MQTPHSFVTFLLRVALGWLMFYAGITKVLDPAWSAKGYLASAKTFTGFYHWLASPSVLPLTDFVNEWGLTLLGASLILGIAVRLAGALGALLMILYYFPVLTFPSIGEHSYLIDEHIVYAAALLILASMRAGRAWGLEEWCANLPFCRKFAGYRSIIG